MDKEIIIDGVNVGGCEILQKHSVLNEYYCHHVDETTGLFKCCKNKPNCYYKQLKRKEQELQQLKAEKDLYKTWYRAKHSDVENELDRLKAENEKLKEALEAIKDEMEWQTTHTDFSVRTSANRLLDIIKQAKREE